MLSDDVTSALVAVAAEGEIQAAEDFLSGGGGFASGMLTHMNSIDVDKHLSRQRPIQKAMSLLVANMIANRDYYLDNLSMCLESLRLQSEKIDNRDDLRQSSGIHGKILAYCSSEKDRVLAIKKGLCEIGKKSSQLNIEIEEMFSTLPQVSLRRSKSNIKGILIY